ncbi:MAG: hypothetical protein R3E95_09735 [Thiolinea sp.]
MTEKPQHLHDLLTLPFYQRTAKEQIRQLGYPFPQSNNPTHQPYFDRVVDLSYQLRDALLTCTPETSPSTPPAPAPEPSTSQATVYVAPVNDSLYDQRATLVSELEQFSICTLPAVNRHQRDMESTLAQCSHFVQLLDENYAQGLPFDQHFTLTAPGCRSCNGVHPILIRRGSKARSNRNYWKG